jgi:ubiquinone/menaquinone biosynthesis C-methylase UbiE
MPLVKPTTNDVTRATMPCSTTSKPIWYVGREVLDAGCGTGLIAARIINDVKNLVGVDLSAGMLQKARARCHAELVQGSLPALPFADDSFDVAYSFKVLAHIPDIRTAVHELARVVRPGGHLILEFYNPLSVRGLLWSLKRPGQIAKGVHERQVHVRFDTPSHARGYLPKSYKLVETKGIRVLTPFAQFLSTPVIGDLTKKLEQRLASSHLRHLGSFYCVVAQNVGPAASA